MANPGCENRPNISYGMVTVQIDWNERVTDACHESRSHNILPSAKQYYSTTARIIVSAPFTPLPGIVHWEALSSSSLSSALWHKSQARFCNHQKLFLVLHSFVPHLLYFTHTYLIYIFLWKKQFKKCWSNYITCHWFWQLYYQDPHVQKHFPV